MTTDILSIGLFNLLSGLCSLTALVSLGMESRGDIVDLIVRCVLGPQLGLIINLDKWFSFNLSSSIFLILFALSNLFQRVTILLASLIYLSEQPCEILSFIPLFNISTTVGIKSASCLAFWGGLQPSISFNSKAAFNNSGLSWDVSFNPSTRPVQNLYLLFA